MTESPIFLNFVKLTFSYVVKKMTKPYEPLFRNTRENRFNMREDICSYCTVFCAAFYEVRCGRAVIRCCTFRGDISALGRGVIFFFL